MLPIPEYIEGKEIRMNGIELIAKEREEQIEKHGYTAEHDREHEDGQLTTAALFAITKREGYKQGWKEFEAKMFEKDYKERLIIAGALIAAELDNIIAWETGEILKEK